MPAKGARVKMDISQVPFVVVSQQENSIILAM